MNRLLTLLNYALVKLGVLVEVLGSRVCTQEIEADEGRWEDGIASEHFKFGIVAETNLQCHCGNGGDQ